MTYHYFATSRFSWSTDNDLHRLMKRLDADKMSYDIWYVPIDREESYDLEAFAPQVEGATMIASIRFADGKRVPRTKSEGF